MISIVHQYSHRFVLVLYKIRNPHCRQRTGSPPFIKFRAPQSPHRYSTPRIIGMAEEPPPPVAVGATPVAAVFIIIMFFLLEVLGIVVIR